MEEYFYQQQRQSSKVANNFLFRNNSGLTITSVPVENDDEENNCHGDFYDEDDDQRLYDDEEEEDEELDTLQFCEAELLDEGDEEDSCQQDFSRDTDTSQHVMMGGPSSSSSSKILQTKNKTFLADLLDVPKQKQVSNKKLKVKANHIHHIPESTSSSARTSGCYGNNNGGGGGGHSTGEKSKAFTRCPICKKSFSNGDVLRGHLVLHNNDYLEDEEEDEQEQIMSYDDSSEMQEPEDLRVILRCKICYRQVGSEEGLKSHMIMHEGEFRCRACRRGFPTWNSLNQHEATHKKYNCAFCDKYFMNSGNLKAHERIHTGERPYKCQDCPKAFKQLGGLQYHLKTNIGHRAVGASS